MARIWFEPDNDDDNPGAITLIAVDPVTVDGTDFINYTRTYIDCEPKVLWLETGGQKYQLNGKTRGVLDD